MKPRTLTLAVAATAALLPATNAVASPWSVTSSGSSSGPVVVTGAGNAVFMKSTAGVKAVSQTLPFGADNVALVGSTAVATGPAAGGPLTVRALPAAAGKIIDAAVNSTGDLVVATVAGRAPQDRGVWTLSRGARRFTRVLTFPKSSFNTSVAIGDDAGLMVAWQRGSELFVRRTTPGRGWVKSERFGLRLRSLFPSLSVELALEPGGRGLVAWHADNATEGGLESGNLNLATIARSGRALTRSTIDAGRYAFFGSFAFATSASGRSTLVYEYQGGDAKWTNWVVKAVTIVDGRPGSAAAISDPAVSSLVRNIATDSDGRSIIVLATSNADSSSPNEVCLVAVVRKPGAQVFGAPEPISCGGNVFRKFSAVGLSLLNGGAVVVAFTGADGTARIGNRTPIAD